MIWDWRFIGGYFCLLVPVRLGIYVGLWLADSGFWVLWVLRVLGSVGLAGF